MGVEVQDGPAGGAVQAADRGEGRDGADGQPLGRAGGAGHLNTGHSFQIVIQNGNVCPITE